jgi:hypothetical protein
LRGEKASERADEVTRKKRRERGGQLSRTESLTLYEYFGGSDTFSGFRGDTRVVNIFGVSCMGIDDDNVQASADVGAL